MYTYTISTIYSFIFQKQIMKYKRYPMDLYELEIHRSLKLSN